MGEWIVCEYSEWQYNQITNSHRMQAAVELLDNIKQTATISDYTESRIQEVIDLLCPHGIGTVQIFSLDDILNGHHNIDKIYVMAWQPPQVQDFLTHT
jgi:hypothetical protein